MKFQVLVPLMFGFFSPYIALSAVLPIFSQEKQLVRPEGFTMWINRASSIYVSQNDPALKDFFVKFNADGNGASNLCVPAAIGNALIHEYSRTSPRASALKFPGLSPDGQSVDTSILVRELASRCSYEESKNTFDPWSSVMCIIRLLRESGYRDSSVKLIREDVDSTVEPGVVYLDKKPTLQDLVSAIQKGYQVLASFAHMKWDELKKQWVKTSGHSVGVMGFGKKIDSDDSSLVLYVQNPTGAYEMNLVDPVFDQIDLKVRDDLGVFPQKYSNIEAKGGGRIKLNYPNRTAFLAGLILFNADPESLQEDQRQ
ncbi:MAG: hypothetical protein KGP28_04150 [Bdellovibrionales bacterium]|nr:hypothetical protein [Bdellovibrionales bacterium]